jgi:hypothetical protein
MFIPKVHSGPPPPPLPPPMIGTRRIIVETGKMEYGKVDNQPYMMQSEEIHVYMEAGGTDVDVVEEPALRPSELIKENQNRSMSLISGEFSFIS